MNFPKAMMSLDFTKMDKSMLSYLKYIINLFDIEEVFFIHVIKIFALPKLIMGEWGPILKPDYSIDEMIKKQLQEEVKEYNLPIAKEKMHCEVHEGRPVEEIVAWSEKQRVDIVIVGNKRKHEGSGITPRRMAHKLRSSMLFVSEKSITPIQNITVLIDFSKLSLKALTSAIAIYNRLNGVRIRAVHIIEHAKSQLYPSAGMDNKVTSLMRERSEDAYDKFINENGIDKKIVDFVMIDQSRNSVAQTLLEYLALKPSDLVIMGSVGHGRGHTLLYGSTTESFVDNYLDSPVLVIR